MNMERKSWGVVVLILACMFYWYTYRPEQIRKDCIRTAGIDSLIANAMDDDSSSVMSKNKSIKDRLDIKDVLYTNCLHRSGIEK
jgi:hypothetical protein